MPSAEPSTPSSTPYTAHPMGGCYWTRLMRMGGEYLYHGSVWGCMDLSMCTYQGSSVLYLRGLLYDRYRYVVDQPYRSQDAGKGLSLPYDLANVYSLAIE